MATYAKTNIKIDGALAATRSTTGTILSAASNSYCILNVHIVALAGGASAVLTAGGVVVMSATAIELSGIGSHADAVIYLGPSATLAIQSISNATVTVSGVEFTNN